MRLSLVYKSVVFFRDHSIVKQVVYFISNNNLGLILSKVLRHIKSVSLHFRIYRVNSDHCKYLLFILMQKNPPSPFTHFFSPLPPVPSNSLSCFFKFVPSTFKDCSKCRYSHLICLASVSNPLLLL